MNNTAGPFFRPKRATLVWCRRAKLGTMILSRRVLTPGMGTVTGVVHGKFRWPNFSCMAEEYDGSGDTRPLSRWRLPLCGVGMYMDGIGQRARRDRRER